MTLETLEYRLREILPEEYQDSFEDIDPVPMRSAGLKFDNDGKVAWNEIWGSFCDLAMAGGPPHKGLLLEPGARKAIESQPDLYRTAVEEICRGITMTTELPAEPSPAPGWVRVTCHNEAMAGWLVRAIVMENVSARLIGASVDLPAGPDYRLDKEIKNVVTVIAKTCHYWLGHMLRLQRNSIAELFEEIDTQFPLIEPAWPEDASMAAAAEGVARRMAESIHQQTGLQSTLHRYSGWLGLECPSVRAAIWMMRMMVAGNVLSRREGMVLFVPVNPLSDPDGSAVAESVSRIHAFAAARQIL
jgi:sirohydrochlorin cobaltochelatase